MKAAIPALERYEVTRATREDAPAILNFLKEVASWVKHKNPQQWRDLLNGKLDDHIMDLIEDHETFIIREDGELVATFSLNEEQLEHDVRLWGKRDDDAVYLHKLAVSPRMIGSGLGKEIIRYAIEYVRAKG
ncbi:MAG: GNAT family N-acetyltransferase [Caldibacillus sp.]